MFKDTDEELSRLSSELLKAEEEEDYEEEYDEEYDEESYEEEPYQEEEALPEYDYEDTRAAQGPAVYQNYSNDYGRNLRNYANGYQAYNSDDCDEDLDAFSEDVYEAETEQSNTGLVILACVLASILAAVVLFMVLKYKGVL